MASLHYILAQKRSGPLFPHTPCKLSHQTSALHPSSGAADLSQRCANEFELIMDSALEETLALLRSSQFLSANLSPQQHAPNCSPRLEDRCSAA